MNLECVELIELALKLTIAESSEFLNISSTAVNYDQFDPKPSSAAVIAVDSTPDYNIYEDQMTWETMLIAINPELQIIVGPKPLCIDEVIHRLRQHLSLEHSPRIHGIYEVLQDLLEEENRIWHEILQSFKNVKQWRMKLLFQLCVLEFRAHYDQIIIFRDGSMFFIEEVIPNDKKLCIVLKLRIKDHGWNQPLTPYTLTKDDIKSIIYESYSFSV